MRIIVPVFVLSFLLPGPAASAAVFKCTGGDTGCLIAAIHAANSTEEKDRIKLANGVYEISDVENYARGPNGLPSVTSAIAIVGEDPEQTIIRRDATRQIRLFHVGARGKLNLQQLTAQNGYLNQRCGAAIYTRGYFRLDDAIIDANKSRLCGGGVYVAPGGIAIIESSLLSNNESQSGGAIHSEGKLEIVDSRIIGNFAASIFSDYYAGTGGGLVAQGRSTDISDSLFAENTAESRGGGAWFSTYSLLGGDREGLVEASIENTSFETNHAAYGGAIHAVYRPMSSEPKGSVSINIDRSAFIENSATVRGAGLHGERVNANITNTTISGNVAGISEDMKGRGGGIYAIGRGYPRPRWIITNSTIVDNVAVAGSGGGLAGDGQDFIRVRNSIVAGNVSGYPSSYDCATVGFPSAFLSKGHNIVGVGTGCSANRVGDLPVHILSLFDVVIGRLGFNGGTSRTHAVLPGSPAIDAGRGPCQDVNGVLLTKDQRGLPREADGNYNGFKTCDIGAYELQPE